MKKKYVSCIILITMIINIMPINIFANTQAPINSGVKLISQPSNAGYNVTAEWTSPVITPDPEVGNLHSTEGFNIDIQNTVTSKKEPTTVMPAQANDNGNIPYSQSINKSLEEGYLYRFTVTPYHTHTTVDANGNRIQTTAPMTSSTGVDNQAFFLTNLTVSGTGEGNSITVMWDNPSPLIKNYKIRYSKITSDEEQTRQGSQDVSIDDPSLTLITDKDTNHQRYSYTITNDNIISSANMYDIDVIPLFNNNISAYNDSDVINDNVFLTEGDTNIPVTVDINSKGKYHCVITTDLPLSYEVMDDTNIKLIWSGLDDATINSADRKLEIWKSSDSSFSNYSVVDTFYNQQCNIGYSIQPKPKEKTYYKIVVTFGDAGDGKERPPMYSKYVEYNPSMVPFTPNKPDILEVKQTGTNNAYQLDMIWSAFVRSPYNDNEESNTENNDTKTYVDKDVTYDIWVSDNITGLYDNSVLPILQDLDAKSLNMLDFEDEDKNIIKAYTTPITQYSKKTENGYEVANLLPNTLYYIKIVAKKTFGEGDDAKDYISEPEYKLVFFNEAGNIFTPPMMSKPPLSVRLDDAGKQMITQTDVTIQWKKQWWEIFNPNASSENNNGEWESKFKVEGGKVVFDFEGDGLSVSTEQELKNKVLGAVSDPNSVIYRPSVLDDGVKYELTVVPYSTIEKFAADNYQSADISDREKIYDDYVKKQILANETANSSLFTDITDPVVDARDSQKNTLYTTVTGLTPNTEYVILFRAYRALADGTRLKSDPAYLTITTLPTDTTINEIPTVPTLFLKEKDDVSITVKWRDDGFKYELIVSEKPLENPSAGGILAIPSTEIEENGQKITKDTEIGADAIYYKIEGLFPDTQYYIWVRAISDTVPEPSAWSSPLQVSTDPLAKPDPPSGLGLASKQSLLYVNDADKTQYQPSNEKYLILEWMKDPKDTSEAYATAMNGDQGMLGAPEIKSTMLAMYNNLIANKWYYVKAATRVVVTKGGQGAGVTKTFSYVVQLADNEDFTDAIEIEIPTKFTATDNGTYRMEISDFCTPKRFLTSPSSGEYDADVDPDLYPLPNEDFELIYDKNTDTLTHRLRSNEIGKDGMPDNRVDQRVITKLVSKGLYTYSIDVSKYNNNLVRNRIVEIPYTLLEAFKERQINIQITADNLTLTLKSDWLANEQERAAIGYGDNSKLRITLNQGASMNINSEDYTNPTQYISDVQNISMEIQTPNTTNKINYTASPMTVKLKLDNRVDMYDKNIDGYIYNRDAAKWERIPSYYDSQTAKLNFATNKVTAYTAFAIEAPYSQDSSISVKELSNRINITDIKDYTADDPITANQLNNLIYSIAKDQKDIQLNKTFTEEEKAQLEKAQLALTKSGNDNVSRQEAINSLVRLYELKTKSPIEADDASTSDLSDMDSVASNYRSGMLKAEEIGLLDSNIARPNDAITLDETASMVNKILDEVL